MQPEILGFHLARAGCIRESIGYFLRAGRRATQRAANLEAIGHLNTGLALLEELPEDDERTKMELDLQLELCGPCMATKGWGAAETGAAYARSRELCSLLGETRRLAPVLYGEYMRELSLGRLRVARTIAEELLRFGEQHKSNEGTLHGHRILSWVALYCGEFSRSRFHVDQALRVYEPKSHEGLKLRYGYDTRVAVLCARAIEQSICGDLDQAERAGSSAICFARELNHEPTLAYALILAGALPAAILNDPHRGADFAQETLIVADRVGSPVWSAFAHVIAGWSTSRIAPTNPHPRELQQGLVSLDSTAPNPWRPMFLSMLADIQMTRGEVLQAIATLRQALKRIEESGERSWQAAILHQLGSALAIGDPQDVHGAVAYYREAIELARSQGAKLLELRATTSLTRLHVAHSGRDQECEQLTAILGSFDGVAESPDVTEARELLSRLPP